MKSDFVRAYDQCANELIFYAMLAIYESWLEPLLTRSRDV